MDRFEKYACPRDSNKFQAPEEHGSDQEIGGSNAIVSNRISARRPVDDSCARILAIGGNRWSEPLE